MLLKENSAKLFYILVPLLFLFPLFKESLGSFLFILLSVNTFLFAITNKVYPSGLKKILLFTIPFWIVVVNCLVFYTKPADLLPIQNALLFLLFPLIFLYVPAIHFTKEKIDFYITILKYSCLIIAVGYICGFLYVYDFSDFFVFKYGIPKFRDYVYYEINFFKIHPTYYTAIVMLCCAYCFDKVLRERKYWEMLFVFAFIFITFLLLVKVNIVFLTLLLLGMLLFRSTFSLRNKVMSSALLILVAVGLAVSVPGIKNRFVEMYDNYDKVPVGVHYSSTNVRVSIYKCCLEIAREDGLWGVGFPNLGDELMDCYSSTYNSSFYAKKGFLSHNYFLYIFLSSGILGLLIFLFYIYKIAYSVFRINNFVFTIGMVNILVLCFTEDFLYRQFGLFYFSLLFFTFYNSHREHQRM